MYTDTKQKTYKTEQEAQQAMEKVRSTLDSPKDFGVQISGPMLKDNSYEASLGHNEQDFDFEIVEPEDGGLCLSLSHHVSGDGDSFYGEDAEELFQEALEWIEAFEPDE